MADSNNFSASATDAAEKTRFDDREQITDLLNTQKHMTSAYNTFLNECATPEVIKCFSNILGEEHDIQNELFTDMQSRGWYQTKCAEAAKLGQAVKKFACDATN